MKQIIINGMVKVDDIYHNDVLELFHHRCIKCPRPTEIVHEIVPRSRRPKTWMSPENRVSLCSECHSWAHERGARASAEELTFLREKRLLEYYG